MYGLNAHGNTCMHIRLDTHAHTQVKTYETIVLAVVVFCGCETRSRMLSVEHKTEDVWEQGAEEDTCRGMEKSP
jgi:hypothetical protein